MVVRYLRRQRALERVTGIGGGVDQRHVDTLFAEAAGAIEVGEHALLGNIEPQFHRHRRVIAVDGKFVVIGTGRQIPQMIERRAQTVVEYEVAQFLQVLDAEFVHHVHQPPMPGVVAGRQRKQVADYLFVFAHVVANDVDQHLVDFAALGELHDRDQNPLLVNLARIGTEAAAADVDHVRGAGEVTDQPAVAERRVDEGKIVQVPGTFPRIVGDVGIALEDIVFADVVDEITYRRGHRVDVPRGAGNGLRHHQAFAVEYPRRDVAGLAHRGRKRGTHQRQRLLLDDRDQPVPHDLHVHVGNAVSHDLSPSVSAAGNHRIA